jgi:hypothetical protein
VSGGIAGELAFVVTRRHHQSINKGDGADRYITVSLGQSGLGEGKLHRLIVGERGWRHGRLIAY